MSESLEFNLFEDETRECPFKYFEAIRHLKMLGLSRNTPKFLVTTSTSTAPSAVVLPAMSLKNSEMITAGQECPPCSEQIHRCIQSTEV